MRALDDLRRLLQVGAFRRLVSLRLFSQTSDGMVQAALASYLFFSAERQTTPADIAAVTAATLLPFTLVGPFTGLVLDRWSRRDVLVAATTSRALLAVGLAAVLAGEAPDLVLYVVVVAGFGINRFLLAGLSAALPHAVDHDLLLDANAVLPTAGTISYVAGLGVGGLAQGWLADPVVVLAAVAGWSAAAVTGAGFARPALGPDRGDADVPPPGRGVLVVLDGLRAAVTHLSRRPSAAYAIALVAAHRLCAALTLTAAVLLYRSTYASADDPQAGLAGLSVAVLAAGLGFVLAAVVTPTLVARWSTRVAVSVGLSLGGLAQAVFSAGLTEAGLVVAAFALSLGGQVVKICADTRVQRVVDDLFRGRVFVLYDMAFNIAVVSATCLGALVLPPSGRAPGVMAAASLALLVAAWVNVRSSRTWSPSR